MNNTVARFRALAIAASIVTSMAPVWTHAGAVQGTKPTQTAAVDIDTQKASANKIQTLLLEETPIIFAYFYNYLIGARAGLTNVRGTAIGHIWPDQVSVA